MADEGAERILKILLKYVTDVRSVEQAKAAAGKLTEAEKAVGTAGLDAGQKTASAAAFAEARMALLEKRTRLVIREVERLRGQAEALQRTSTAIAGTGALIAGPFVAAATAYVGQAGRAEETSRRWGRATERISEAYQDVGRVAARTLLPLLERAAELSEQIASFTEQHPGAVTAALGLGGGLVALGTLGTIAAQGIRLYADVKLLAAAALQNTAADKMLLAAGQQAAGAGAGAGLRGLLSGLGGAVGPVLGGAALFGAAAAGAGVGFGINELLARTVGGPFQTFGKIVTVAGYQFGRVLDHLTGQDTDAKARKFGILLAYLTGEIDKATARSLNGASAQLSGGSNGIQSGSRTPGPRIGSFNAAIPLFINYQEQLAAAERDYGQRRTRIVQDYVARGIELEQQYAADRTRLLTDFVKSSNRSARDFRQNELRAQSDYADRLVLQLRDFAENEQRTEANYYEQRLKRARDFDLETQRAEEDHQAALAELQSDHADRARELAGAQDALGLVKEQRRYEKERQAEEQNYSKSTRRRNEDYARELADGEEAFREQREQRLADFEQQQADQKEQFEKDRAERKADFAQRRADEREDFQARLADLDAQHAQTVAKNKANFEADLRTLDTQHAQEKAVLAADFKQKLLDLDAALLGEQKKRQEYYKHMAQDLEDFLRAVRDHHDYTPRKADDYKADGGYAGYGLTMLGERGTEYVLNANTTSAAERLLGGRLSQERLLAGLQNNLTVNFGDLAFQGTGGQQLVQAVTQRVEAMLTSAFDQFAAQAGAA